MHKSAWDCNTYFKAPIPGYNALQDMNLRTHYEKQSVRHQLFRSHLVDRHGRILQSNKTKVAIIEQEFANAAGEERRRERSDRYEKMKLDAKKQCHRSQQTKVLRSMQQRTRERERRGEFWSRASQFLPPPPPAASTPGAILSQANLRPNKAPATHRPSHTSRRSSLPSARTPPARRKGGGGDADSSKGSHPGNDSDSSHGNDTSSASSASTSSEGGKGGGGGGVFACKSDTSRKSSRRVSLVAGPGERASVGGSLVEGVGASVGIPIIKRGFLGAQEDLTYDSLSDYDDGA